MGEEGESNAHKNLINQQLIAAGHYFVSVCLKKGQRLARAHRYTKRDRHAIVCLQACTVSGLQAKVTLVKISSLV